MKNQATEMLQDAALKYIHACIYVHIYIYIYIYIYFFFFNLSPGAQIVKSLPAMQET